MADRVPLSMRMVAEIRAEVPGYESRPTEEMAPGVAANVEQVLRSVGEQRRFDADELSTFSDHGRVRAGRGVPIDQLLHAWRLSVGILVQELVRVGRTRGATSDTLLELAIDVHAASDRAMLAVASGHREYELEVARLEGERRADFVRGILYGSLGTAAIRIQAETYGLDPDRPHSAFRAVATESLSPSELERRLGLTSRGKRPGGLAVGLDGDLVGFVERRPELDIDTQIGIGPPAPLENLATSFRSASRAANVAAALQIRGVVDLAQLGIRAAVVDDRDVGEHLVRRYIEPLSGAGDMAETLIETVEAFLSTGMRIGATATQLFLHPNTLRYRLKRFEDLTSSDLRDPQTVLEVWWAIQRSRLALRGDPDG